MSMSKAGRRVCAAGCGGLATKGGYCQKARCKLVRKEKEAAAAAAIVKAGLAAGRSLCAAGCGDLAQKGRYRYCRKARCQLVRPGVTITGDFKPRPVISVAAFPVTLTLLYPHRHA